MPIRTPVSIDAHVRKFCGQIKRRAVPVLMPITPDPGAEALDCFHNVRRKVEESGGRMVFGWAIWEWPGVYLEAEHHAVYAPPGDGPLCDVTPSQIPSITLRLFLPDESAEYDFENEGVRRENHRLALRRDPLIEQLFQTAIAVNSIMNSVPGVGMVSLPLSDAQRLEALQAEKSG